MELDFSVFTFNVRGLRGRDKRIKIFDYLNDKTKNGIFLLQETHSTCEVITNWSHDWGSMLKCNSGTSNSKGTLIAFSKNFQYNILKYVDDNNGRIQICATEISGTKLLLVNIYNDNIETEQVKTLTKLNEMLDNFENIHDFEIVMGGDWNVIFDKVLDAKGGNPSLKFQSLSEISKLSNKFGLCDIFRIRHPNKKNFTFRQPTPRKWRRLDFFLVSNSLQDSVRKVTTHASLAKCDHSPVALDFSPVCLRKQGPSYWKYNASLVKEEGFCEGVSHVIQLVRTSSGENELSHQAIWELTKYRIREFCIKFSKTIAKNKKERLKRAEQIISDFENSASDIQIDIYAQAKADFESIMDEKINGLILRSKTQIYQDGEKSSKFFLNLEKKKALGNTIRTVINPNNPDTEIKSPNQIMAEIKDFYVKLFSRKSDKTQNDCKNFVDTLSLPSLSDQQNENLNKPICMQDLQDAIKKTQRTAKAPALTDYRVNFTLFFGTKSRI